MGKQVCTVAHGGKSRTANCSRDWVWNQLRVASAIGRGRPAMVTLEARPEEVRQ